MWSVTTIITGLISFMVEKAPTLGSIETNNYQKKKFARLSLDYNVKNKTFTKLFPHLVTLHKEIQQERKELGLLTGSGTPGTISDRSLSNDKSNNGDDGGNGIIDSNGIQAIMAVCAGFVALLSILFAMRFL